MKCREIFLSFRWCHYSFRAPAIRRHILYNVLVRYVFLSFQQHIICRSRRLVHRSRCEEAVRFGLYLFANEQVSVETKKAPVGRGRSTQFAGCCLLLSKLCSSGHVLFGVVHWFVPGVCCTCIFPWLLKRRQRLSAGLDCPKLPIILM